MIVVAGSLGVEPSGRDGCSGPADDQLAELLAIDVSEYEVAA